MTISTVLGSTVLGYPRIGPRRELKKALESYWEGRSTSEDLRGTGSRLRAQTWQRLVELGLSQVPSNTFSDYDQVLDTAVLLGAIPDRYRHDDELASYFAMARGSADVAPLPMTKWFDTNYHYIVPEIEETTTFHLDASKPLAEFRQARELGIITRPVIVGPITFLLLSNTSKDRMSWLPDLVDVYSELLAVLAAEGVPWVQLDEPALVVDRGPAELAAVTWAYTRLGELTHRPRILVASYFGDLGDALPALSGTPIEALGLDLVRGSMPDADLLAGKTVVAGVVSGRDVWRTDLGRARRRLDALPGEIVVSTSCSLLHVPYDVDAETDLDPGLRTRLAFAEQKVAEVVSLANGSGSGVGLPIEESSTVEVPARRAERRSPYEIRAAAQAEHLRLPELPVTTIGSFPQTDALRAARAAKAAGRLDEMAYRQRIEAEIERVIRLQEQLGLDVLVHGEPERNDMVQYFAEHLDGFVTTRNGWVQSYGSRCTRPPIIVGEVTRPGPITVGWAKYAQSLTDRPVKGMLTGPVTIVAWSFKHERTPLSEVVWQVASALRDEVRDLEAAGISVIQVDEPALRELMPLRGKDHPAYLAWAVEAYRHATSGVSDRVQIHTHLCYSDAAAVMDAIDGLDADVTTIESARSHAPVPSLDRGLGPGVYDIHSPRVPSRTEVMGLIAAAAQVIPRNRLWVNPDCGLKTRSYLEVEAALRNLVDAARESR